MTLPTLEGNVQNSLQSAVKDWWAFQVLRFKRIVHTFQLKILSQRRKYMWGELIYSQTSFFMARAKLSVGFSCDDSALGESLLSIL